MSAFAAPRPVPTERSGPMPGFPPEIAEKIVGFLRSGVTGNVQIDVVAGTVRGCRLSEYVRAGAGEIDSRAVLADDSGD